MLAVFGVLAILIGVLHVTVSRAAPSGRIDLAWGANGSGGPPFDALECGNPARQYQPETALTRGGAFTARFEERPGDVWAPNGTIRCLVADYTSGESNGDDYYYAFSLYVPAGAVNAGNLVWVLHQPQPLWRCGVAPYALHFERSGNRGEGLFLRVAAGACRPNANWSLWKPNIPLRGLDPVPRGRWIDLVVHIRFDRSPNGVVDVWARVAGSRWPGRALVHLTHIPTMPSCSTCGTGDVKLYNEFGLYNGAATTSVTSVVYVSGFRRGTSLDAVAGGFPSS